MHRKPNVAENATMPNIGPSEPDAAARLASDTTMNVRIPTSSAGKMSVVALAPNRILITSHASGTATTAAPNNTAGACSHISEVATATPSAGETRQPEMVGIDTEYPPTNAPTTTTPTIPGHDMPRTRAPEAAAITNPTAVALVTPRPIIHQALHPFADSLVGWSMDHAGCCDRSDERLDDLRSILLGFEP